MTIEELSRLPDTVITAYLIANPTLLPYIRGNTPLRCMGNRADRLEKTGSCNSIKTQLLPYIALEQGILPSKCAKAARLRAEIADIERKLEGGAYYTARVRRLSALKLQLSRLIVLPPIVIPTPASIRMALARDDAGLAKWCTDNYRLFRYVRGRNPLPSTDSAVLERTGWCKNARANIEAYAHMQDGGGAVRVGTNKRVPKDELTALVAKARRLQALIERSATGATTKQFTRKAQLRSVLSRIERLKGAGHIGG